MLPKVFGNVFLLLVRPVWMQDCGACHSFFHFDILCFPANNVVYQFYTPSIMLLVCHCFHPKMNGWCCLFKKIAKSCQALSAISWMAPSSTSCRGSWSSLPMVTTEPSEGIQRSYFKIINEPVLSCSQLLFTGQVKSYYIPRKKYTWILKRQIFLFLPHTWILLNLIQNA